MHWSFKQNIFYVVSIVFYALKQSIVEVSSTHYSMSIQISYISFSIIFFSWSRFEERFLKSLLWYMYIYIKSQDVRSAIWCRLERDERFFDRKHTPPVFYYGLLGRNHHECCVHRIHLCFTMNLPSSTMRL